MNRCGAVRRTRLGQLAHNSNNKKNKALHDWLRLAVAVVRVATCLLLFHSLFFNEFIQLFFCSIYFGLQIKAAAIFDIVGRHISLVLLRVVDE